ncbi:MAG: 4-phosphoerythronate dehydrogenase [Muribaculaceae bacterium]|nr:4-phosphoerythronate dehydrogenase [Muribaculaceae bacterium]
MKPILVIEDNIPFIKGILDDVAKVYYLRPEEITSKSMKCVDGLVTRTRTLCNASLLDESNCRFIATATIGTDHIDLQYCKNRGITVANAPGCNAPAVAQYVMASILYHRLRRNATNSLCDTTLGVVGVGHVGSIVAEWARQLGMTVLECDPPRKMSESGEHWVDLNVIAERCDYITFHTPLTRDGIYATYHLADDDFYAKLRRRPAIINSARGAIVNTEALLRALDDGRVSDVMIDCWEQEPNINPQLLKRAFVATPHIAGYSREGKIRATAMAVKALTRYFDLPDLNVAEVVPEGAAPSVTVDSIMQSYSPEDDTKALKTNISKFETLRNNYLYRQEVK